MKIDSVIECKYELVTVRKNDYRRYFDGEWTAVGMHFGFAIDVRNITGEEKLVLEKAYQEYRNEIKRIK